MTIQSLRGKFLLSLLFAVVVVAGLSFYADAGKLAEALAGFEWRLLPAILALTLLNYCLRFLKWQFYLGQIGVRGLTVGESAAIFFSGLAMVVTPGKLGEWLKSYLLRARIGVPFFRSAPVILAERLTDGLAMVLLATGGLVLFHVAWEIVAFVIATATLALLVCWVPPLALLGFSLAERVPLIAKRIAHIYEFYYSARTLLGPRNLLFGIGIGFVSWSGECVAFGLVLAGLGQPASFELMVQAAFILAVASLGGSILLTPGGLGVAEGGITGLAQLLLGMPRELAVTAALLIRLSTLWFGVAVGLVTLMVITRRMGMPVQERVS